MLRSNLHLSSEDTCKLGCGIKMEMIIFTLSGKETTTINAKISEPCFAT